jgi:hypothetical protein
MARKRRLKRRTTLPRTHPSPLLRIDRLDDCWVVYHESGDTFRLFDSGVLTRERREPGGPVRAVTVTPAITVGEDLKAEELRHYGVLMQNPPHAFPSRAQKAPRQMPSVGSNFLGNAWAKSGVEASRPVFAVSGCATNADQPPIYAVGADVDSPAVRANAVSSSRALHPRPVSRRLQSARHCAPRAYFAIDARVPGSRQTGHMNANCREDRKRGIRRERGGSAEASCWLRTGR